MTDKLRVTITRERGDDVEVLLDEALSKATMDSFKAVSGLEDVFETAYGISMNDFETRWALHLMDFLDE